MCEDGSASAVVPWPEHGAGEPIPGSRVDQLLAETRGEH
jgi:hypothetical protein